MRATALCIALLTGCVDGDGQMPDEPEVPVDPRPPQPPPPQEPDATFAAFFACMTFDDFVAADMAGAWSGISAQNNTECRDCHGTAVEYSGDAPAFFDQLKQRTYVQLKFFGYVNDTVVVNETTIPNVGHAVAPHIEHPRFNPQAGMAATKDLYFRTQARLADGNCP
jgi:hypothetical protein